MQFDKSETFAAIEGPKDVKYYNAGGKLLTLKIESMVETKSATTVLGINDRETNRNLKLITTLSTLTDGKIGATIPSYITQIETYSNAAGRVNLNSAVPGNLAYVHCEDDEITLDTYVKKDAQGNITAVSDTPVEGYVAMNEYDEFWGETIIISKPTGEDKNETPMIVTIAISSIAVIGVGIILIKKYALKK